MFMKFAVALYYTLFLTSVAAQTTDSNTETTTTPVDGDPNTAVGAPIEGTTTMNKGIGNSFAVAPTTASVNQFLDAHNGYRKQFGTPNMTYASSLFQGTYNWAVQCQFRHSSPNGAYGEDLYAATYTNTNYYSATYNWVVTEYPKYNYNSPGFSEATGHFTQVVWVATTGVACATALCPVGSIFPSNQAYFIVCRYIPAGNVQGQFPQNVRRLQSSKEVGFELDEDPSSTDTGNSTPEDVLPIVDSSGSSAGDQAQVGPSGPSDDDDEED